MVEFKYASVSTRRRLLTTKFCPQGGWEIKKKRLISLPSLIFQPGSMQIDSSKPKTQNHTQSDFSTIECMFGFQLEMLTHIPMQIQRKSKGLGSLTKLILPQTILLQQKTKHALTKHTFAYLE